MPQSNIPVETTPTLLYKSSSGSIGSPTKVIFAIADDNATIFLGDSDVTVDDGAPFSSGNFGSDEDIRANTEVYAVCASGTVNVRVFLQGAQ